MKAFPHIEGYDILACLGGGSLSSVYSARSHETDALCAVKVLRPDWSDQPVAIKLLQREARAAFSVSHPNLVTLLDASVLTGPYFLVMELLPGESLRRRLRRDYSLGVPAALWITRQIAEALAALHRKGFMHGDVKPDNIRIAAEGRAVLLDLGFAHRQGENAVLLEEGYILGTVNYLAPELCNADPVDEPRGDVFSLGVTLFEMLAGQLPYPAGDTVATLQRHQCESPADIRTIQPHLPSGLANLLDRLLAPAPEQRPTAAALVQELVGLEIATLGRRKAA